MYRNPVGNRGDRYTSRRRILISTGCLILFLLLLGAGCSESSNSVSNTSTSTDGEKPAYQSRDEKSAEGVANSPGNKSMSQSSPDLAGDSVQTRKVIVDGRIKIKVDDTRKAMDDIVRLAETNGGYVVSSRLSRDDEDFYGTVVLKIPFDKMSMVSGQVASMGELQDSNQTSQDVTDEYIDAQARLKVLQEKEQRLLSFMAMAQDINELISVENEIASNRSQIEVIQGRLKYLDNNTDYSQLTVDISQTEAPKTIESPKDPWGRGVQALVGSLNLLVDFLLALFLIFMALLPWLLILIVLLLLIRLLYRRRRNKRLASMQAAYGPVPPSQEQKDQEEGNS